MEVRIYVSERKLHVEVRDNGVGISAENQQRLFNKIVQFNAKAQQAGGGTGLGLWICKKIIDMHGGAIGMRSEGEGHGSTFFFSLHVREIDPSRRDAEISNRNKCAEDEAVIHIPSIHESEDHSSTRLFSQRHRGFVVPGFGGGSVHPMPEHHNSSSPNLKREETMSLKSLKVLVVDDSGLNRKMMVQRMRLEGCCAHEADDGDAALEVIHNSFRDGKCKYDVITMDNVRCTFYSSIKIMLIISLAAGNASYARYRGGAADSAAGIQRSHHRSHGERSAGGREGLHRPRSRCGDSEALRHRRLQTVCFRVPHKDDRNRYEYPIIQGTYAFLIAGCFRCANAKYPNLEEVPAVL